jgi:hypothetical protein
VGDEDDEMRTTVNQQIRVGALSIEETSLLTQNLSLDLNKAPPTRRRGKGLVLSLHLSCGEGERK